MARYTGNGARDVIEALGFKLGDIVVYRAKYYRIKLTATGKPLLWRLVSDPNPYEPDYIKVESMTLANVRLLEKVAEGGGTPSDYIIR